MQQDEDYYYMKEALKLAKKGEGYTSPNPMVGAIVVKEGKIVGKGYHQRYGGPHAEVYALDEAGPKAENATIYVTLEPCSHYGKTPPCSKKIIKAGIKRAVIAMEDPNPIISGRGIRQLQEAGIKVEVGLLEEEARDLNEVFIKYMTEEIPFVYLKIAQTLDGFIATKTGDSKWITNEKARLEGHKLRHKVDAIIVGIGTVLNDNPSLTTRLPDKKGRDPIRIILDSNLKTPLDARVINQRSKSRTIIVTGEKVDKKKVNDMRGKEGVEILSLTLNEQGRIPLKKLLKLLHNDGISSVLVEGGGKINYSFIKSNLVDKIYCFISDKILGGNDGVASFMGDGPDTMEAIRNLKGVRYKCLDDNILITGSLGKGGN